MEEAKAVDEKAVQVVLLMYIDHHFGSGSFWILATKTQSHEATQSILSDIFVPWCLCGLFV